MELGPVLGDGFGRRDVDDHDRAQGVARAEPGDVGREPAHDLGLAAVVRGGVVPGPDLGVGLLESGLRRAHEAGRDHARVGELLRAQGERGTC